LSKGSSMPERPRSPDDPRENSILRALPPDELDRLVRQGSVIEAKVRDGVFEPGRVIDAIYFPLHAVYSQVATTDDERFSVEVATMGHEGMVGLPVFLGTNKSPNAAFCQIGGTAFRVPVDAFTDALATSPTLRQQLMRYTQATMVFLAQCVACNRSHDTIQRAARWLLLTHDRVRSDTFDLTQDFMAQMLGVRRATVSEVQSQLRQKRMVEYSRGRMTITDREGLEQITCECYRIVRDEFDRLLE